MKKKKQFKEYDDFTLKRIQEVELEILKDFMDICDRHGLDYFGIAGTGIGALRHHGFIPWDDDIDVAMPRDDFEKLLPLVEKEMGDKYLIMNAERYPNYPLMTTRMTMRGTKFKEEALKNIDAPLGIFLDLYPLDKVSDNPKEARRQARDAWFWSKILILRSIPFPMLGFSGWKAKIIHAICGLAHLVLSILHVPKTWIYKKAYEAETRSNHYTKTKNLDFFCDTTPYMNLYAVKDIYPLRKLPFEDVELNFPYNLHNNLTGMYGDYMQLPPEEKRKNHYPYELEFFKEMKEND
ncbi:LicD family protein [Dorea longicatena]|uniref:LICD family protein n=1 Tax=Dorea longicatena DSM 13814 TaxID=411462 RepID=A6BHE7_9FIRM|nr:LicD family protein [Dorea longicatena]EDM62907.1 LICD family protein [Dorea longicatena DSM 13814]UWP23559.1 LicD family protein [Dorea longicatena]